MFDSVENALKGGGRKVVRGVYGRDVYRSQVRKRIETRTIERIEPICSKIRIE